MLIALLEFGPPPEGWNEDWGFARIPCDNGKLIFVSTPVDVVASYPRNTYRVRLFPTHEVTSEYAKKEAPLWPAPDSGSPTITAEEAQDLIMRLIEENRCATNSS